MPFNSWTAHLCICSRLNPLSFFIIFLSNPTLNSHPVIRWVLLSSTSLIYFQSQRAASKALCVWPLDGRPAYLGDVDSWEATENKCTWKLYSSRFVGLYIKVSLQYIRVLAINNTRISGIGEVWTVPKMMNTWPHETSVVLNVYQSRFGKQITSFPNWDNFLTRRWGGW